MKKKSLVALSILVATTASLHAESLEERKYWKGQMDYINRAVADGEKACGVKFSFELVGKEQLRAEMEKNNHSPNGICNEIIKEVTRLCRAGNDEKTAVKAKITGFQCGYGKPRSLDLKGGVVSYMGNGEESSFSAWAKPWLMKKL
ncbi:MAG: hypothetical protein H7138_00900 [Myxococcales bacterium]|nr:hypothetical protein [Myxococcales bacterium]